MYNLHLVLYLRSKIKKNEDLFMSISDEELGKMYEWIISKMKPDVWYPVKSEKAFELILHLFNEGLIPFCEFNDKETHFRKIDEHLFREDNL